MLAATALKERVTAWAVQGSSGLHTMPLQALRAIAMQGVIAGTSKSYEATGQAWTSTTYLSMWHECIAAMRLLGAGHAILATQTNEQVGEATAAVHDRLCKERQHCRHAADEFTLSTSENTSDEAEAASTAGEADGQTLEHLTVTMRCLISRKPSGRKMKD
jgi:hypothetical protein